jgi:hypothetical protein
MSETTTTWLAPANGASVPFAVARPPGETIAELCDFISLQERCPRGSARVSSQLLPDIAPATRVSEVPTSEQRPLVYWFERAEPAASAPMLERCLALLTQSHESIANFRRFGTVVCASDAGGRPAVVPAEQIAAHTVAAHRVTLDQFIAAAAARLPPPPERLRVDAALEAMWERALPRFSPSERRITQELTRDCPFFVACQMTVLAEENTAKFRDVVLQVLGTGQARA